MIRSREQLLESMGQSLSAMRDLSYASVCKLAIVHAMTNIKALAHDAIDQPFEYEAELTVNILLDCLDALMRRRERDDMQADRDCEHERATFDRHDVLADRLARGRQ